MSDTAKKVMNGKPVMTIIGCRNMWVMAQEKMKKKIRDNGGQLVCNVALVDRAPNLVSVATILRWMLTGKKDPFGLIFPKSGVSDKDVTNAVKFGEIVKNDFNNGNILNFDQNKLNKLGAVNIFPNLIILEKRANALFGFWSKFIRKKGGAFDPNRRIRLKIFTIYLFIGIVILSPLTTIISWVVGIVFNKRVQKQVNLYSQNEIVVE